MDDLISRQALKQAMYHEAFEADTEMQKWDGGCWIRYKLFEKIVDILPSVQPKQKTGHWITDGVDYRCSACGFEINDEYYLGEGIACPNCGTFMPDGLKNFLG